MKKFLDILKSRYLLIFLLLLGITSCYINLQHKKKDVARLQMNITALMTELEEYKFDDSIQAAKIHVLTLKRDEFESLCKTQQEELKALHIRLKDVKQYANHSTEYIKEVNTIIYDTIIVENNTIDTLRCFVYNDIWTNIDGCINHDSVIRLNMAIRDTITQVLEQTYKHRFLWFRWGKNGVKQTIYHSNPNVKIDAAKIIEII